MVTNDAVTRPACVALWEHGVSQAKDTTKRCYRAPCSCMKIFGLQHVNVVIGNAKKVENQEK